MARKAMTFEEREAKREAERQAREAAETARRVAEFRARVSAEKARRVYSDKLAWEAGDSDGTVALIWSTLNNWRSAKKDLKHAVARRLQRAAEALDLLAEGRHVSYGSNVFGSQTSDVDVLAERMWTIADMLVRFAWEAGWRVNEVLPQAEADRFALLRGIDVIPAVGGGAWRVCVVRGTAVEWLDGTSGRLSGTLQSESDLATLYDTEDRAWAAAAVLCDGRL